MARAIGYYKDLAGCGSTAVLARGGWLRRPCWLRLGGSGAVTATQARAQEEVSHLHYVSGNPTPLTAHPCASYLVVNLKYEDDTPVDCKGAGRKVVDKLQQAYAAELANKDFATLAPAADPEPVVHVDSGAVARTTIPVLAACSETYDEEPLGGTNYIRQVCLRIGVASFWTMMDHRLN